MQATVLNTMELLQFGIQEEIKAQMGYSQKTRKEYSTIEFKCKYPNCQAKFKVKILDKDKYQVIMHSDTHDHSAAPKSKKTISSLFVRNYLKHYFESNMNHATAQLKCFQDLNISYTDEELLSIFAQGPDALRKFAQRAETVSKRFSTDDKVSLAIFVEAVQENSPEDLIEFISEPGKLVFLYAPFEAKAFGHQISTFHIDSTYKLLKANIPLYALTGKAEYTNVFPFLYFFISPDTSENIQYCVCRYFQYINREPEMISMDCAPQIAEAIERGIPNCHILWCGVHVLRAISRKADKFKSRDNFEEFYNLMKILVFDVKEDDASPEEEQHQEETNETENLQHAQDLPEDTMNEEENEKEEKNSEHDFQPSQIFLPTESSEDQQDTEFIPEEELFETSEEIPEHLTQEEATDLDAVYERILDILSTEPKALKYFNRQWRHHLDRWNKRYRDGGDATNNVSESHFKVLKHSFFPERRNIRLDDFVIELYTTVVPSMLIKLKSILIKNDKIVRIMRKVNDQEQLLENKKAQSLKMLEAIYTSLEQGSIDTNLVYCTLKVLLKKKQLL